MPPSMRDFRYASGRHRTRRRYNTGPGYWSVFSRGFDCVYKLKHSAAAKQLLQGVVCLLWLLSPTCAAQGWYTHDDSITNGSISCHYMNSDRQLGRLCTAKQAVFYRIQQEPGQIVDMLGSTPLLKLQVPAPPKDVLHPAFEVSNRIVRSSSFFGDYLLTPVAPLDIERSCEAAEQLVFRDRPVVFLVRDHAEMSHFLAVQLTPLIAALKAVGWDKHPFQLIVIDRQNSHPPIRSERDIFTPILDKLSGSKTLSLAHLPSSFCAERALVGVGTNAMLLAHDLTKFFEFQTAEEVDHNRAAFADMRTWVLQAFGLVDKYQHRRMNLIHSKPPAVTIIDRGGPPTSRRIINQDTVATAAAKYGKEQIVRLQDLSFESQLKLMMKTDIMIAAHGSASAMMVFLPPQAVLVEIKAYRHGLTHDFTHGHCNLARATNTSLLVWHNRHVEHTFRWEGAGKNDANFKSQHTFIPEEEVSFIMDSALKTWQTPVVQRDFNDVWFLNPAEPLT